MVGSSVEDRAIFGPLLSRGLAATNENASPEPVNAMLEEVQLIEVAVSGSGLSAGQ